MAGLGYKKYLTNQLDDVGSLNLGPSPYTQDGYRRGLLGEFYDPVGAKKYAAEQDRYSLDLKEEALGLPEYEGNVFSKVWGKLKDLGKWGVSTPVGRGALWIADIMDRPFNAIEGTLEETRDQALASNSPLSSWGTIKAAGTGALKGIKAEKDYNLGRWVEKLSPEDPNNPNLGNTLWQDFWRFRPVRTAMDATFWDEGWNEANRLKPTDALRGMSGPQKDPEYAGFKNMTNADILGLVFNLKTAIFPAKLGRIRVPGGTAEVVDEAATAAAKAAKAASYGPRKFKYGSGLINQVDEAIGAGIKEPSLTNLLDLGASGKRAPLNNPFHVKPITKAIETGDPSLRRVLQLNFMGQDFTPFLGAQLKAGDALSLSAKKGLSYAPGLERALSHVTNRIESTNTLGASKAFDVIDDSRQGARIAVNNQQARFNKAMQDFYGKGAKLTDNENKVLYYATTMGRDLADPKFLDEVSAAFQIPMDELRGMTRLEPLRQWWLGEAAEYAARGEKAGFFKALDTDYMPIFSKDEYNPALYVDDTTSFGQEFSGLRSFQKSRNKEFVSDLLQRGARGELAIDNFTDAIDRYARSFASLDRRKNILEGLEKLGLASRQRKNGFKPLADTLKVDIGTDKINAQPWFMNEHYLPRFRDEIFGYGGGGGLVNLLKGVSKIQNPWKAMVTTLSPKYHTGNLKDDIGRNFMLGDTSAQDLAAAVSRGTSKPYVTGISVEDWTKRNVGGLTQWDYTPGARSVYDLTAQEASDLGRAMGVNIVQTTDEIARTGAKSALGRIFNKTVNAMEAPQGVMREANFLGGLRNQGNSRLAREIVNQDLINYRDISPFLRDFVRPAVPFVTFRAKNPAVSLNQFFMNPTWFGRLAQLQQNAQGDDDNLELPLYYRDKPVIAWKDNNGNLQIADTGLSQFDSHFLLPGERQLDQARRMPGPLVQAPLGLMTGQDSLGRPIRGPQESNWIDGLLFGQKGADGKTYTPGEIKFIFDTLTGELGNYNINEPFLPQLSNKFGQIKTFNGPKRSLEMLLEKNRLRDIRLGNFRDTGTYIPPKQFLEDRKLWLR